MQEIFPVVLSVEEDKLALLIGKATMTWNDVQGEIFEIFTKISGLGSEASKAIYFTLKADKAQREITEALSKAILPPLLHKELSSLLKVVGDLAGERNATTHSIWAYLSDGTRFPNPLVKHHGSLNIDQFDQQLIELEKKLVKIGHQLAVFNHKTLTSWMSLTRKSP